MKKLQSFVLLGEQGCVEVLTVEEGSVEEEKNGLESASNATVTLGITVHQSLSALHFTSPRHLTSSHLILRKIAVQCSAAQNRIEQNSVVKYSRV
jgi:hypothetical protein